MSEALATLPRSLAPARVVPLPEAAAILSALPMPAIVLDAEDRFRYVNPAAELFFQLSFATLAATRLADLLPEDSRLFALLAQVRQHEVHRVRPVVHRAAEEDRRGREPERVVTPLPRSPQPPADRERDRQIGDQRDRVGQRRQLPPGVGPLLAHLSPRHDARARR